MKKLLYLFLLLIFVAFPSVAFSKTAFIGATGLKGGTTGALDAVECEDIRGDDSDRAVETGDIAIVLTSGKDIYFYIYNKTGTDAEDDFGTNDPIVPDDRADCSNAGQWELFDSINLARTAEPSSIYRDLDCTDSDDNARVRVNCVDASSGTEDCELFIELQIGGVEYVDVFHIDCDTSGNCHVNLIPQGTGVIQFSGSQIDIGDLAAGGNWTPTGTINLASTTDTVYKDGTMDAADMTAVMKTEAFTITLGNDSDAITEGKKITKTVRVPFKHDLDKIIITTDETSGNITIDVWVDEAGATTGLTELAEADSLFDSASEPVMANASTDRHIETTAFDSGEDTDIPAGSYYVINVDAVATLTYVGVTFELTRKD